MTKENGIHNVQINKGINIYNTENLLKSRRKIQKPQ